jgi:F420-non-reducing hydrogenase small subunit
VNPKGVFPQTVSEVNGKQLTLPEMYEHVFALSQVIDVDYYLPGCPPPPDLIANAVFAVLSGKLPPKGTTLAPHIAMCDVCERNKTKPARIELKELKRVHEVEIDSETCFLAKGVLCMGPATRSGCGNTCVQTNVPCRGCFGQVAHTFDSGAKFLSAIASLLKAENDDQVESVVDSVVDPAGYFYRFTHSKSILGSMKP